MMNKLIELKNLTKNFDDQQVLRGINLDIYEKEFLTLLGPADVERQPLFESLQALKNQVTEKYCLTGLRFPSFPRTRERLILCFRSMLFFLI